MARGKACILKDKQNKHEEYAGGWALSINNSLSIFKNAPKDIFPLFPFHFSFLHQGTKLFWKLPSFLCGNVEGKLGNSPLSFSGLFCDASRLKPLAKLVALLLLGFCLHFSFPVSLSHPNLIVFGIHLKTRVGFCNAYLKCQACYVFTLQCSLLFFFFFLKVLDLVLICFRLSFCLKAHCVSWKPVRICECCHAAASQRHHVKFFVCVCVFDRV